MTKSKWFYPVLTESINQLRKDYEYLSCQFQMIEKDRVVEYWKGQNENNVADMILVTITKQGKKAVVIFYKTEYLRGFPVSLEPVLP